MKLKHKCLIFFKELRTFCYQLSVYVMCSSLVIFSDPSLAQQGGGLLQTLIQGFGNYQQQQQQQSQAQQAQMINQQMQQAAMEKHNAEMMAHGQLLNSLVPQIQPARFFNNCTIPSAKSNYPRGACEIPRTERNVEREIIPVGFTDYQKAISFKSLANNYVSFYEQLMSTSQNSAVPVGLQCLVESKEKTKTNILDRINYLRQVKGEMIKNNQIFRDNSKSYIESIKKHNLMLDGKGDLTRHDIAGEFRKQFGNGSCLDVIKASELNGIGGLKGLRENLAEREQAASQYSASAAKYRSEVEMIIVEAKKDLKARGIDAWLGQAGNSTQYMTKHGQLAQFGALQGVMSYEKQKLDTQLAKVKKELNDINIKMPALDLSFKDNLKNLSEKRIISGYMRECMLDPSKYQLGATAGLSSILDNARMLITNEQGTTKTTYDKRAREIIRQFSLSGEESVDSLIARIAALDKEYFGMVGIIRNDPTSGKRENLLISSYMTSVESSCKKTLQDTSINPNARSTQISEATKALKELDQVYDSFTEGAMATLKDWVLNCNGREYKPNGSSCSAKTLTVQSPDFCTKHAETCSSNTLSCNKKVTDKIVEAESNRARVANEYNKSVEGFVTIHNAEIQKLKDRVVADMEFLKGFIPGANYPYPITTLPMPEPIDTPYGVMLRGGTSPQEMLDSGPAQVDKMIEAMEAQQENVMASLEEYIEGQRAAMDKNHGRWEDLLNKCTEYEKNYIESEIAKANQQQQMQAKQQEEIQKKMAEEEAEYRGDADDFCTRFGQFQSNARYDNPGPACDMAEALFKDAGEVSKIVSRGAITAVNEFHNYCQTIQSERSSSSRDGDEDGEEDTQEVVVTAPKVAESCNESEGNVVDDLFSRVKNHYIKNRLEHIEMTREEFDQAITTKSKLEEFADILGEADYQAIETIHRLNPASDAKSRNIGNFEKVLKSMETALEETNKKLEANKDDKELKEKAESLKNFIAQVKSEGGEPSSEILNDLCQLIKREELAAAIRSCHTDSKWSMGCVEEKNLKSKDMDSFVAQTDKKIAALYQNARSIASSKGKDNASTKLVRLGEKVDDVQCEYVSPNSRQSSGNNFIDSIFSPNNKETSNFQRILDQTRDGRGK